jgi:hypothetical protein
MIVVFRGSFSMKKERRHFACRRFHVMSLLSL